MHMTFDTRNEYDRKINLSRAKMLDRYQRPQEFIDKLDRDIGPQANPANGVYRNLSDFSRQELWGDSTDIAHRFGYKMSLGRANCSLIMYTDTTLLWLSLATDPTNEVHVWWYPGPNYKSGSIFAPD
jgi:hypothetical protein